MTSLSLSSPKKERSLSVAIKRNKSRRNVQKAADTLPLALCDDDASLFTVSVTIGTQPFQLVLDTASTDLWVTAQDCEDCIQTPNRYDVTDATPLYENVLENVYESISGGNQVRTLMYLFIFQHLRSFTHSLTHSLMYVLFNNSSFSHSVHIANREPVSRSRLICRRRHSNTRARICRHRPYGSIL